MLAVLETGNSNIVFALMERDQKCASWRMASDRARTAEDYAAELRMHLREAGLHCEQASGIALASVVAELETTLAEAAVQAFGMRPTILSWRSDLGIVNRCEPPESVGIDRLLNGAAAYARFGGPVITVDLGTATTFDLVSVRGEFLGGAIAPGLRTAADALSTAAPRLPRVELTAPTATIARNTQDALRSGIVMGCAVMVDGMVERMRGELGARATCIATGGLAPVVTGLCQAIDHYEPDLTLTGIRLAFERTHGNR